MEKQLNEEHLESDMFLDIINEDFPDAVQHGMNVSNMAKLISKELGLSEEFTYELSIAGMLHDIGKIKLASYLYGRRENTLHIEEMKYMRMHSQLSYDILKDRGFSDTVLESVLYHHENFDGSGYPQNLKGEDIPMGARIIRVCDVFAALISKRPYRDAFDSNTAFELMIDEVKNFDMSVFLAFQRVTHSVDLDKLLSKKIECIFNKV